MKQVLARGLSSAVQLPRICAESWRGAFTPEALANYGLLTMGDIVKQLEIAPEGGYARHGK